MVIDNSTSRTVNLFKANAESFGDESQACSCGIRLLADDDGL